MMIKISKINYLFCLLFVLSACGDKIKLIKQKDEKGRLVATYQVKKSTKVKEGVQTLYDTMGRMTETAMYVNDTLHGERVLFYPSGAKQYVETYQYGQYDGLYQAFYEDGSLELEGLYVDNAINGEWKKYYQSGQLMEIVNFENNEENGPFIEYHQNGKLKARGNYLNGDNEHGLLELYDKNGELERKMNCDNGTCRTSWTRETKM